MHGVSRRAERGRGKEDLTAVVADLLQAVQIITDLGVEHCGRSLWHTGEKGGDGRFQAFMNRGGAAKLQTVRCPQQGRGY